MNSKQEVKENLLMADEYMGHMFPDIKKLNLTITGGIRDSCEFATDAAIVVKNSDVIIRNNKITRNYGDQTLIKKNIVGIMGICGRENSNLRIYNNLITKIQCDNYLELDLECRKLKLNEIACTEFLSLSEECRIAKITGNKECENYIYLQAIPQECQEADIKNHEKCKKYLEEEKAKR